jgi:hypothetical protein
MKLTNKKTKPVNQINLSSIRNLHVQFSKLWSFMNRLSAKELSYFVLTALIFTSAGCTQKQATEKASIDAAEFANPPAKYNIHTWWHWLDGNITREGITKDLEAMHQQGVVQATILNIGLFGERDFGIKKVEFNTPEWYDMFRWALQEAKRLNISIGVHNCDGWSTSGGPWITPEMSIKQFTWTKTMVDSQSGAVKLLQPLANLNYYKEVAILAVKSKQKINSFHRAKPEILFNDKGIEPYICDGSQVSGPIVKEGSQITFKFSGNFTATKIAIMPRRAFMWSDPGQFKTQYTLYASKNGTQYQKVQQFSITGINQMTEIEIPSTTASYFKLEYNGSNKLDPWPPVSVAECELLQSDEQPVFAPAISYLSEKTVDVKAQKEEFFHDLTGNEEVQGKEVIDLTGKLMADGTLDWKPTVGTYSIIRFGYTSTGAFNAPATKIGTGLECDKMDTSALNLHFSNFPSKIIAEAGQYAGNTFKFMLVDSWECGFQNWTAAMLSEFEKRRGYSLKNYLPLLCGEEMVGARQANAILYDFRKTIAELIEENYYIHYKKLLHAKNIEYHSEVIYGNANYPPLDILRSTVNVDLPMYEFWTSTDENSMLKYYPANGIELNMPSCAAIGYEKPVMASEAYTGMANYSEAPGDLKPFGDKAYCAGINQMILHSYVHQPNDTKPGMTLGPFGSHFNRNNSYWPYIGDWFTYQSRIQYLLQNAIANHDVLYYLGDQLPQFLVYNASNQLPFGYMFNACNFDILKNRIRVENGTLILNNKIIYHLLSLPPFDGMDYATLERIGELVQAGVPVYGAKPTRQLSAQDMKANGLQFAALADKIWGSIDGKSVTENNYGKGRVFWGMPLASVLKRIELLPDLNTQQRDSVNLIYLHKKSGDIDFYFIANQTDKELRREFTFRIGGKTPEIWDPQYGTVTRPAIFGSTENTTTIPRTLKPFESVIFVFRNQKPEHFIVSVSQNGKVLFPAGAGKKPEALPNLQIENGSFVGITGMAGNFELTTNSDEIITLNTEAETLIPIQFGKARIQFYPEYPAKIVDIETESLQWLNENSKPEVKYFSGKAVYTLSFGFPTEKLNQYDSLALNLGEFGSIAGVSLNGVSLGNAWYVGQSFGVKQLLKEQNTLVLAVASVYRNRLIGDFVQFGKVQTVSTSAPVSDILSKESPLVLSGLRGPVTIKGYHKKVLN